MYMKIGVVIVTYNRRNDIEKTLSLYEQQTISPLFLLVVNNKSTDGTEEFLNDWALKPGKFDRIVITTERNLGGSGGFRRGMDEALRHDECNWILLADDDAFPHTDVLQKISEFAEKNESLVERCSAICGMVDATDHIAIGHRCRIKKTALGLMESPVPADEYGKEWFEADMFSYIGVCIRKSALEKAGPTRDDFFIYADDYEHSMRIGKEGKIICVPSVVFCHQDNNPYSREASWRDYYATRNILIAYKEHFGNKAFHLRALKRRLTALRSLNPQKIKVFSTAIKDAKEGKTGIHPIYKPGWTPEKKQSKKSS